MRRKRILAGAILLTLGCEARLLHAEYPPGYTPKRPTQQMVVMPYLEPYIDVLAAYLAEP